MSGPPRPVIAFVTVVRDDLPGLLATRDSLRIQRRQDFAWIVVDGGSTDGTAGWLRAHGGEPHWWRSAPDDGPFDAMNTGLEAALRLGTSHVLFLNAGDRLAGPGTAELLRRAASDRPEAALLYGDALETGWDGRPVLKRARSHRTAPYGMFTHHQAMLYRCDALAGLRYDGRYRVAADYDLTLRLLRTGASAVRLPFSVCRFASGGLSQRSPALGRSEQSRIRRDVLNHGLWFSYAINGVQWLAGSVRRQFPRAYAKWRYRDAETVGLSDSLHPD